MILRRRPWAWVLALGLLAVGCGPDRQEESSELDAVSFQDMSFSQWCAEWQLQCAGVADNGSVSAEKMRGLIMLGREALRGDSQVVADRDILFHASLQNALDKMGARPAFERLFNQLGQSQWQSLTLQGADGRMHFAFQEPQPFLSQSRLKLQPDAQMSWEFAQDGTMQIQGLRMSNEAGDRGDTLRSYAPQAGSFFRLAGDQIAVTEVPAAFLASELGLDIEKLPQTASNEQIGTSLRPLTEWMILKGQRLQLPQSFFDVLHQQADVLIDVPADRENAKVMAQALEQAQILSQQASHMEVRFTQRPGQNLKCVANGSQKVNIDFNSGFGLEKVELMGGDAVLAHFFGIQVKSKIFGPFSPKFHLKRVELYPDHMVIRDIPVIGSYKVRYDEMFAASTLECSH